MENEVGRLRLYLMRIVFLLTFVGLAPSTWTEIITYEGTWDPLEGVAMAFSASLSALAVVGILYPVRMVPLLILQLMYKLVWLLGVGLPLWNAGVFDDYTRSLAIANAVGVALDIIAIPWMYIARTYITKIRW